MVERDAALAREADAEARYRAECAARAAVEEALRLKELERERIYRKMVSGEESTLRLLHREDLLRREMQTLHRERNYLMREQDTFTKSYPGTAMLLKACELPPITAGSRSNAFSALDRVLQNYEPYEDGDSDGGDNPRSK